MKKIFYLASIAALALSSCAKDQTTEAQIDAVNGGAKITAAMAADDTRTSLEKVDGKYEFRWSAGDQLGVYGVGGGLNNAAFVLNNNSDGQAVGVFASQNTELKADGQYVAVYPRFQTSLFSAAQIAEVKWPNPADTSKEKNYPNYEAVKVNIPAVQKYQPETFYTQTVPAVSTTFTVGNDGAEVSMQPVVDYLFVNIKSTEPISKLTLTLMDGKNNNKNYALAGEGTLEKYILNKEYRYMLKNVNGAESIILEMDESSAAVTCHDANTYVFAVPAGILGMGGNVKANITVNDDKTPSFTITNATGDNFYTNAQLNGYTVKENGEDVTKSRLNDKGNAVMRLENTVFWANALDKDGNRTSFEYNPNNDYVIEHEGQLLKYLTEYNNKSVEDIYHKDAFICSEHVFDFSLQHMRDLTTELKADGSYNDFQKYISNYLADNGTFPCTSVYVNEFKGNGAVITDIERPLASAKGIFGEIKKSAYFDDLVGTINDVTLKNVGATVYNDAVLASILEEDEFYLPGVVLGSVVNGGKLIDVTVENASGLAILSKANVATYNALTVVDADELSYVIADMEIEKDLTFENWDVVSAAGNVFGAVNAVQGEKDGHHVVTMPAGADYSKLAAAVGTGVDQYYLTWPAAVKSALQYGAGYVNTTDALALSVLIGDESYWTGDKIGMTISKDNSVDKKEKVYFVNYAEELAKGSATTAVQLTRDMNMSYNYWNTASFKSIDGADKTITGINMNVMGWNQVAPFNADVFTNLNINGVAMYIATGQGLNVGTTANPDYVTWTVPTKIAGLSLTAKEVTNVDINNLVINAYAGIDSSNNTEAYYSNTTTTIGWLVAEGNNIYVTDSSVTGVNSNVRGMAGLVGIVNLVDNASQQGGAQINNSSATIVAKAQSDLEEIVEWSATKHKNVAGTVGKVVNHTSNPKDIKFVGGETPTFTYDSPKAKGGVTVVYGNYSKTYNNKK